MINYVLDHKDLISLQFEEEFFTFRESFFQDEQPSVEISDSTVCVNLGLLDRMMILIGELILIRSQVLQCAIHIESLEFLSLKQSLDIVTSELQSELMKMRMQPFHLLVPDLQAEVRRLEQSLEKDIELVLHGTATQVDKTLLDALVVPLTLMIQNSCIYGIENLAERARAGKTKKSRILLRIGREGSQIVVELTDDGSGLDPIEKNREVAVHIEKLGGTLQTASYLGKGSKITLKITLALAIVPALIVKNGRDRFAIPQINLAEVLWVDNRVESNRIEYLEKEPVYRLRGTLLPLVLLEDVLKVGSPSERENRILEKDVNIVVLNAEGHTFGVVVDEIMDTTDIVVKPLSRFLKSSKFFSGATIMGDGFVSLILDPSGLAEMTLMGGTASSSASHSKSGAVDSTKSGAKIGNDIEFLLFRLQNRSVHAMPLGFVSRLEKFPSSDIRSSGEQRVIQYRNSILPLISLNSILSYGNQRKNKEIESNEDLSENVIVVRHLDESSLDRHFGVVVDEIVDIVSVSETIDEGIRDRPGIQGSLIYGNEVLVVVDMDQVIEKELNRLGGRNFRARL